ncbi:MAG: putative membrane-bound dehydrogenase-like protein, partial [Nonlabens sp.]
MKKNRYYYGLVLLFLIVLVGCFIFRENLSVSLKDNVRSITDVLNITKADLQKPKYAHRSMELHEGLEVSLWAAEPDLFNPTNINVDHLGRTWLIEALNYRNDFNPNNPYRNEGDRILILEDTNDDGSSDSRKVFYQGEDINAALGIWVMDNKVIVSASPNILLLTDEDRDGKADKKEKLFTNLGGENHDHGAHAFIFGPDGRLYFVLGNECKSIFDSNGVLIQEKNGRDLSKDKAHLNQGMALRCELDGTGVELVAHNLRNSFELTTDSYGTIWLSDNDDDGNKATRLNYIMEYGNFGYSDEVTGAGWRSRRVSMHDEIPKRHWHQNDPGSIPSLLYTGSGSPAGIAFYEGDQLPEIFQNQMIHCEPGHGVVRAYPLQKDGAGYKAETIDIMKSKDQWFRPSDVCVAPDGSLMVADWYDSGVGGHRMGDTERGRLFRITAKGKDYETPTYDLTSPEGAAKALVNPNMSLRYMAWTKLEAWDNEAEEALLQLWNDEKQTTRARALWLLGRLSINGKKHLTSALTDNNPDIRITALRAVRQLYPDMVLNVCEKLAMDAAPEVRREVGIALRYNNDPIAAAKIWTKLANQYNGEDRWYLEALGLAADLNADVFFEHWEAQVGTQLEQPAAIDIIWRMRTEKALPYLVEKIKDEKVSNESLKKYFRAFHFIRAESKNTFLAELLDLNHPLSKEIATYTLEQMDSEFVKQNPAVKAKINIILPKIKGTHEWLIAIRSLQLESEVEDL